MFADCLLYLTFYLPLMSFQQPADSGMGDRQIDELYRHSYQVFTGFLTNKYQSSSTLNPGTYIVEFDVTEIQKGPRRQKVLTYISESDSLDMNSEYLVFMTKGKKGQSSLPQAIYKVCHKCDNAEIKKVYEIVGKKPFRRIKQPLPKYTFSSGCGC